MKYLVIDAMFSGTGIRDLYTGEYLQPNSLSLSSVTVERLKHWLLQYIQEHDNGYASNDAIDELDREGKAIASTIKRELLDAKVLYCSDAKMTKELIA